MIDQQLPCVIGVDLGGTNIHAGVVDINNKVLGRRFVPTLVEEGPKRVIERLISNIRELKEECRHGSIKGIGIGAAGIIDMIRGAVITSPNFPGWQDVPLKEIIFREFDIPTALDNDANAAAFGEFWAGAGRGSSSMIGLTLGTGVGGGIILNGHLWHGSVGMAGEIGHMTIVPDGLKCPCGNRGCLESYASATAIVNRTKSRISRHQQSNILSLTDAESLTSEKVYQAAVGGDELAKDILYETGVYLGLAIGALVNILDPEIFIIGGGASKAWDFFSHSMKEEISKRTLFKSAGSVKVVPAELGNDAGLIGAGGIIAQSLNFN
ncbi:MAG: ROK family protein [bacterium]